MHAVGSVGGGGGGGAGGGGGRRSNMSRGPIQLKKISSSFGFTNI